MNTFQQFQGTESYLTDRALEAAVNCAIALQRPLLIKGEPGTGKTLLAEAISKALGLPLIAWSVKSTTRAQDGLYIYDTVQRLYDARFGEGDTKDIQRYIKLGPLGQAFAAPDRVVLLIDEVDKADLEFPNDLLHELDRMRFKVLETGVEVVARERPIVIITSNNEKELPDAFLRRCVFHFIDFPDAALMKKRRCPSSQTRAETGATSLGCFLQNPWNGSSSQTSFHQRADRLDFCAQAIWSWECDFG